MGFWSKLFGGRRTRHGAAIEVRPLTAVDAWQRHAAEQAAERKAQESDRVKPQPPGAPLGAGLWESTLPESTGGLEPDEIEEMHRRLDESRQRLQAGAL